MSYQNINQYNFKKIYLKPVKEITDLSLASDEKDYDEEVIFSSYLIAEFDGQRMPLKFDFDSSGTTSCVNCGTFSADTIVSENYWNPKGLNLELCTGVTELCNVGLTGIDNGLVSGFTGSTIEINSGLYSSDEDKFSRYKYDARFKMHPVTGFTTEQNRIFDDGSFDYNYSYGYDGTVGNFLSLSGGFYQGFYKLQGYDYQVLPERYNWGWSAEFLLRQRRYADFEVGLNKRYPENIGTFFYIGARAENKFYHFANGDVQYIGNINGTWNLYIEDFYSPDSGYVDSFTLTICDSENCYDFVSNQTNIIINDFGTSPGTPASVYPVTFNVSGITNIVTDINLTINNYYHTYAGDVGMLLVTPDGTPSIIAGVFGTGELVDNITVTLSSSATTLWDEYSSGVYLNNSTCYGDMLFSSPCPYQYNQYQSTKNLKGLAEYYSRVTEGLDILKTCACNLSATSASTSCTTVYPQSALTDYHCTCSCGCTCPTNNITGETDPLYDGVSNALSFRLSGESNPRLCVKTYRITGGCETTGSCETTGITYTTGTSLTEWCSTRGIFDECKDTLYIDGENWVQIDAVFVRDIYLDECDLQYKGGLKEIVKTEYIDSLNNNSVALVTPPITHEEVYAPPTTDVVNITEYWINEKEYRKGKLKFYVNGKLFFVVNDFEEIIPRPLNVEKEKQIGVSYNISLGGGTQGLHDNLTLSGETGLQQDPELLPTEILNQTEYSGLTTNIKLEEYFGGSFIGDISAFRFYSEPLNASQIKHNYKLLRNKYTLLDPFCPNCVPPPPSQTPTNTPTPTMTPTNTVTPSITPTETPTNTPTPSITPSTTEFKTPTPTQTPTVTQTPSQTPTMTVTPTSSETPTPTVTPTNTPTPSVTPPTTLRAYLFIEPQTGSTNIGQWMYDTGSNFYGFTNDSQPSQNQMLFDSDMNRYVDFTGWTTGDFPTIIQQVVPQVSGGLDEFDNPIVAYNFKTTEIPANTVGCQAWYTWIIPTYLTNNLKQYEIDYNSSGNPDVLTPVRTESTIYSYTFNYTGSTIPNTTYRVYTTYPNSIFELNNNQNIYFRGNSLIP